MIEDACSFAWFQLLRHQTDRNGNWRGWLFRVAQREAWRLNAEQGSEIRLVRQREDGREVAHEVADPHDRYEERLEFQPALEELRASSRPGCRRSC